MVSIRSSISDSYVSLQLARIRFEALTDVFERLLEREAPSFGRKKFLKQRDMDGIVELADAFDELPVNTKEDLEKINEILLEWNHAISGLKKYIMDILGAVKLLKLQVGKINPEDKQAVLDERDRIAEDLLEFATEIEMYIKDKVNNVLKSPAYLDNPNHEIERRKDSFTKHLQTAIDLAKEEDFMRAVARSNRVLDKFTQGVFNPWM